MEGSEGDDWFRVWIHSIEVVNRAWWGLEGAGRRAGCEAVLAGAVRMMRQPWTGWASRMTLGGKLLANVLLAMVVMSGGMTALAQTSNSHLAVSSDGKWLAVANRDNGSVTVVDLAAEVAVTVAGLATEVVFETVSLVELQVEAVLDFDCRRWLG